jgi:hypothetical protein
MLKVWSDVTSPTLDQPYWVGEIWVSHEGKTWLEDTIIDTEKEHFVRRVREEIDLITAELDYRYMLSF